MSMITTATAVVGMSGTKSSAKVRQSTPNEACCIICSAVSRSAIPLRCDARRRHSVTTARTNHAAPDRTLGAGPYSRLILRDVTIVDGTGAPAYGPADIVVEGNRIAAIHLVGHPTGPRMQPADRPQPGADGRELDLAGHWVLPGLVDAHGHIGWPGHVPNAQYVYDLWLGHGITAVREPGCFI